eukprot:COSAG02_NODE_24383_length_690_cov_0.874788_1_plen_61_part_10
MARAPPNFFAIVVSDALLLGSPTRSFRSNVALYVYGQQMAHIAHRQSTIDTWRPTRLLQTL